MSTDSTSQPALQPLPYALVDVFAESPLEGNPLAIFTDATGLSDAQMQALARETNLSETTFILPADPAHEQEHGVRVRIFTTQEELPFAGHPTLGTASWLHANHPTLRGAESITLNLAGGRIPVRFASQELKRPGVFATMRQNDPVFGAIHDPIPVAPLLGLSPDDLHPTLPVQTVSTGLAFCIVPLRSVAALDRLAVAHSQAEDFLCQAGARFFFCLAPADDAGTRFQTRMQFYNGEDPATGSASGCAIAYLVHHGAAASGEPVVFEQGRHILRPSRITVQATAHWGESDSPISDVFVAGRTIPVATGHFFLPAPQPFPTGTIHQSATNKPL